MKLFYSPGSCSLASHIALREGGVVPELVKVDLRQHRLEDGSDYYQINPKGAVPALELPDGAVLTEGAAVLQYIGDHHAPALVPANGTLARARLQEMLNYLSSSYHKSFSPLFRLAPDANRTEAQQGAVAGMAYVDGLLAKGGPYVLGAELSVADLYLFVVTSWAAHFDMTLDGVPALAAFMERVGARPAVKAAMVAEGLVKGDADA